jgi:hypothetical protein
MLKIWMDIIRNPLHLVEDEHFVSAAGNSSPTVKPAARLYTSTAILGQLIIRVLLITTMTRTSASYLLRILIKLPIQLLNLFCKSPRMS